MNISEAIIYTTQMHNGQKRKDGSAYIFHPLTVALRLKEKGYPVEYQLAGLFHDLLEDTDATEDRILELSSTNVLEAVKLLTKSDSVSEDVYISIILDNDITKAVKNVDRIHNLQEAMNGNPQFVKRYLSDTKENYVGKFSQELDDTYNALLNKIKA